MREAGTILGRGQGWVRKNDERGPAKFVPFVPALGPGIFGKVGQRTAQIIQAIGFSYDSVAMFEKV